MDITYKIEKNGYTIFLDGQPWITQYDEFSKPMDKTKTIKENCLMQIEELTRPVEPQDPTNTYGIPDEVYHSIIDDYTMELFNEGTLE